MRIRPTDLFELVLYFSNNVEVFLKELLFFFNVKISENVIKEYIVSANETGSKLIGENLGFSLSEGKINNCSIWLRCKRNNYYIIEINFIFKNIQENYKDYFSALKIFTLNLAKRYAIKNYYCGLEPAADKDNQYFSDKGYGTLYNEFQV